jgi:hypothetical protein
MCRLIAEPRPQILIAPTLAAGEDTPTESAIKRNRHPFIREQRAVRLGRCNERVAEVSPRRVAAPQPNSPRTVDSPTASEYFVAGERPAHHSRAVPQNGASGEVGRSICSWT